MAENVAKSKKKKVLWIVIPIILLLLIGVGIAIPFLLKGNKEIKVVDLTLSEHNTFVYGENVYSAPITVKYENGTSVQIKLSDTIISDADKAKLENVGNYIISITYKGFRKNVEIVITPAEFTSEEIENIEYEDKVTVLREGEIFFPVKSIPEGSSVSYSVDESAQRNDSYNLTAPGTYTIHAYISRPNYKEVEVSFSVRVIDATFDLEGFDFDEDKLTYILTVASSTEIFNFEEIVNKSEDIICEIYSDEECTNKINSQNLTLNEGNNFYYMILSVDGIPTTQKYTINIYKNHIYNIGFYFNNELLENIRFDEGGGILQNPNLSKLGYDITGWKHGENIVEFPFAPNGDMRLDAIYSIIHYQITYDLNDGNLVGQKNSYTIEDEDFTLAIPTREGHVFAGWGGSEIEGIQKNVVITKGCTGDKTFIAHWEGLFNCQFKFKDQILFDEEIKNGNEVENFEFAKEGYEIDGWLVNGEKVSFPYTVTQDVVFEANWKLINYDITFNLDGGILENAKTSYTVEDENYSLPVPVKEGYDFVGWKVNNSQEIFAEYTIQLGTIGNIEFTAIFEIQKFTIIWNDFDGRELEKDIDVNYGTMPSFDGQEPNRTANAQYTYNFIGWSPKISTVTKDCIYTAVYETVVNKYDVTFDSQNGSEIVSLTKDYGTILKDLLPMPERRGYRLLGWFTQSEGGEKIDENYQIVGNANFFAHWEIIDYKISIDSSVVNGQVNIVETANYNERISFSVTPNAGYRVRRVYYIGENSQEVNINESFVMPDENITIYVVFEAIDYNIITGVTTNGSITISKNSANVGDKIEVTINAQTGYELDELYYITSASERVNILNNSFIMPTDSISVHATFKIINYQINKAEINNGSVILSKTTANYGDEIELTITAEIGYQLDELYYINSENEKVVINNNKFNMPADSVTIYARFIKIDYQLTTATVENGSITLSKTVANIGDEIEVSINADIGYQLDELYYINSLNERVEIVDFKFDMPADSVEVVASFEVITYKISYELNGGNLTNKVESYNIEDESFTIAQPIKTGYTFLGWEGSEISEGTKEITIEKGSFGDRSYTAKWQINQYTYTFYNGDEIIKQETIDYNASIEAPENPIKASEDGINYFFNGWDNEIPSIISDQDLTFNAVYREEHFSKGLHFTTNSLSDTFIVDKGTTTDIDIIVPSTYNHKKVVKVADNGFAGIEDVKTITLSSNITTIGSGVFANCANLQQVNNLTSITTIPAGTFENCNSLESFEIGENVIIIGERAFKNTAIVNISIPASIIAIESTAFDGAPVTEYVVSEMNSNYSSKDGNLYNKNLTILVKYAVGKTEETFIIPGKVKEIAETALLENSEALEAREFKLKNLVIPSSVEIIGSNTIDKNILIFTYMAEEPENWDDSIILNNTIYWDEAWDFINGVPQSTLAVSQFKTGIYQNWMSYIKDEVRLFDVVMPGSHDAGTNGLGSAYRTQNSGFYDQLIGGVRYFDTRVAEYGGNVRCVHANSGATLSSANAQGVYFKDLLNDVNRFINDNPSEIIMLDFQHIWNDFSSNVLPMLLENIPSRMMLKKSQTSDLSSVTMGQLREWGVNVVVFVNDELSYSPDFNANEFLYQRSQYLLSPYDGSSHRGSGNDLINHFPTYYEQSDGTKLFVLQSQRTGGGTSGLDIANLEKDFRGTANAYLRSLTLEENADKLAKLNVVMRDFVVDDNIDTSVSAQETMQSILFLNINKDNVKLSRDAYFKIMLDYDYIESTLSKLY